MSWFLSIVKVYSKHFASFGSKGFLSLKGLISNASIFQPRIANLENLCFSKITLLCISEANKIGQNLVAIFFGTFQILSSVPSH